MIVTKMWNNGASGDVNRCTFKCLKSIWAKRVQTLLTSSVPPYSHCMYYREIMCHLLEQDIARGDKEILQRQGGNTVKLAIGKCDKVAENTSIDSLI